MLLAMRTTILSSRACALTGSAMTSRRRRNSRRGPPRAPRMSPSSDAPDPTALASESWGTRRSHPVPPFKPASHHNAKSGPAGFGRRVGPKRSSFVQPVEGMERTHRKFRIDGVDQHRELDLGRCDRANVDALFGERLEGAGRYAGMAAHADADGGH